MGELGQIETEKLIASIQDIVDFIEDNMADDLSVIELSRRTGLSPWHFQRVFKSFVGDSLGNYLRLRRLTKAASYLKGTELGVLEIAIEVGFGSNEAFTRAFKANFGKGPREFRENRSSVQLATKPALSFSLLKHLADGIQREPNIVTYPLKKLVGFTKDVPSPFAQQAGQCGEIADAWIKLFENMNQLAPIEAETYYGLYRSPSGTFCEDRLTYFAGVSVANDYRPPDILTGEVSTIDLPSQRVAEFQLFNAVTEDRVRETIDAIYGYWLPNSNYLRASGSDFEVYKGKVDFEKPDLAGSYFLPISSKASQ